MENENVAFSRRLKHYRQVQGLTQDGLAERVSCAPQTIRKLEAGSRRPSFQMAERLAQVLALSPEDTDAFVRAARGVEQSDQPSPTATHNSAILVTKLCVAPLAPTLVPRKRLLDLLDAGLGRKLTLLSAPAGFGKTTLLNAWLHEDGSGGVGSNAITTAEGDVHNHLIAWLSLDAGDNDPTIFLRYVVAALQQASSTLVGATAAALLEAQQPSLPAALTTLINDLAAMSQPVLLVLDDYHVITTPTIHEALSFLVDHLPVSCHLVIASREDPPLPLPRLRARTQVTEVRVDDLRFTPDETEDFLCEVMRLSLAPDAVAALAAHTEGWIAGLQLAALAIQDRPDAAEFIATFTSSTRFIIDYLAEEVIGRLPTHLQTFLRQTAILDRICGAVCDAVVLGETVDAAAPYSTLILDELARRQLFLLPLDVQGTWYRYHHLFRDVLYQQLINGATVEAVSLLHRRASHWFAQQGMVAEAMHHALAGRNWDQAIDLIEQHAVVLSARGQIHTVLGWLSALPESQVHAHPMLGLIHAMILVLTDQQAAAEALLLETEDDITTGIPDDEAGRLHGHIAICRATIRRSAGHLSDFYTQMRQAMTYLPVSDLYYSTAVVAAANDFWIHGDVTAATERCVVAALAPAQQAGNLISVLSSITNRAQMYMLQGRLRRAGAAYDEATHIAPEGLDHLSGSPAYYFGLGNLWREWNVLDTAEDLLLWGIKLASGALLVYPDVLLQGYIALARLKWAHSDPAGALQTLDEFIELAGQRHVAQPLIAQARATQAQIVVGQGDLRAAIRWAESSSRTPHDALSFPLEYEQLTLARVLIAQGRDIATGTHLNDARCLLERLRAAADTGGRTGRLLEIDILRALALDAQEDRAAAVAMVQRVLRQAASEGYVRLFVDEGEPLRSLLAESSVQIAQHVHSDAHDDARRYNRYIGTLLAAFPGDDRNIDMTCYGSIDDLQSALAEPLTPRELEVLRLMATGGSTNAIAQELIVANGTIKRHVSNILGKLAVHSRLEAVARARGLASCRSRSILYSPGNPTITSRIDHLGHTFPPGERHTVTTTHPVDGW